MPQVSLGAPRIVGDVSVRPMLIGTSLSLSFVAVLVNPYGTALPRVWLSLMNSDLLPRIMIEHAPLRFLSTEGLMILTLAAVYLGLLAATWRRGLRVTWLVPLIWLVLACSRVRHGPLFAVTAAIAIADMLPHSSLPAFFARSGSTLLNPALAAKAVGLRAAAIPTLLVTLVFGVQAAGIRCPLIGAGWCRLDPTYWPVEATRVLREHLVARPEDRRVFNDMLFGGYLIYNAPEARGRLWFSRLCVSGRAWAVPLTLVVAPPLFPEVITWPHGRTAHHDGSGYERPSWPASRYAKPACRVSSPPPTLTT